MLTKTTALIFILNAALFFFQAMTKSVYPPLLLPFREEFLIDNARAGFLVTLVFFGYALARFPSGVLADRWGCTKTILVGSFAMAGSFLAVSFSTGYYSMAFFTVILGISSGIYVTAGYTLAVIIGTRSHAAKATAAFESFGMVAGMLSPFVVTAFILYLDWSWLFLTLGCILLGATLLLYQKRNNASTLEQDIYKTPEKAENKTGNMLQEMLGSLAVFREPSLKRFIIWSTMVGGLGAISWTGVNAFIPTFLVEEKGYHYDRANSMFAIIAFAGLITKIGVGWLADRLGSRPVLFCNLLLSVLLIFALTLAEAHWQLLVILALLGATCLNTNTLINSYVLRKMPQRYQGKGFGLFCTAYTIIYSCGPFLTGLMSVTVGLSGALRLSAIGAAAAMLLVLFYRRWHLADP